MCAEMFCVFTFSHNVVQLLGGSHCCFQPVVVWRPTILIPCMHWPPVVVMSFLYVLDFLACLWMSVGLGCPVCIHMCSDAASLLVYFLIHIYIYTYTCYISTRPHMFQVFPFQSTKSLSVATILCLYLCVQWRSSHPGIHLEPISTHIVVLYSILALHYSTCVHQALCECWVSTRQLPDPMTVLCLYPNMPCLSSASDAHCSCARCSYLAHCSCVCVPPQH